MIAEFEYFEQSLIENHGLEPATLEYKKIEEPLSPVHLRRPEEEQLSPLSESSLSNTPLSDRDTSPFLTSPDSSCQDSPPTANLDSLHNLQFSVQEHITTTCSNTVQPELTECGKSDPIEIESVVETQEMLTAEIDIQIVCTEKSAMKEELVLEDTKHADAEVIVAECGDGSMGSGGKENSAPSRTRNLSDNDVEDMKPKKSSLSRNKPSSASFNRVLRKLDNSANDTLAAERPGKRLKNRPRSMSSLSTHSRAQNVLEQRDNLINMYALAPDIADMMASVYQTTSSISTTTQVLPDPEENRTLGASPSACSTISDDTPRATGMVRRNPSYEAAEFVMQMGGESEDDEGNPNVSATKHVTLPNESDNTALPDQTNQKSPKKGMRERLSFKKKKNKGPPSEPQSATNIELSPNKRRTKKACVVM